MACCAMGHLACARFLLASGAEVDLPNDVAITPLLTAITSDQLDTIRLLIDARANPNRVFRDPNGINLTPLGAALTRRALGASRFYLRQASAATR